MTWALQFDGVNDYLSIPSYTFLAEETWTIERQLNVVSGMNIRVLGDTGSFNSYVSVSPSLVRVRYNSSGSLQLSWSVSLPLGTSPVIKVIKTSYSSHSLYIDNVLQSTITTDTTSWPQASSFNAIGRSTVAYGDAAHQLIGDFSITSASPRLYSSDLSSHAAGTVILVETISGNDGTGINMPTDGSAYVDLGGSGISVTGDTAAFDYNALAGTVDLAGEILVTGTAANFDYTAINGSIDLTGQLLVIGQTASFDYIALPGTIDLTGEIVVTGSTANFDYTGENGVVELGAVINVVGQTANFDFNGVNAEVSLTGEITIIGDTATFDYIAKSGVVVIGEGQKIGTVTAGFADSDISVQYKQNTITVNFGE